MKQKIQHKGAWVRMCSACGMRARKDETEFLRIVLPKDGKAFVDRAGTAGGRGAYVCKNAACVRKLCKTKRLSHLLKGPVPETVYEELCREVTTDEC